MSDEREPVGSVGEEAVKLLQALGDWAKDSGAEADSAAGVAGAAAEGLSARLRGVNEHIATGGEDCVYCPVCQVISVVRSTSPEVRDHLTSAASSLLKAAGGLLAAHDTGSRSAGSPVEKIDLDDEGWEDD